MVECALHTLPLNPHHLRWIEHHSHQMDALMLVMRVMRECASQSRDNCINAHDWARAKFVRCIEGFEIFLCARIRSKKQTTDNFIYCLLTAISSLNHQCFLSDFMTQPPAEEKHCQGPMEHQTSSSKS